MIQRLKNTSIRTKLILMAGAAVSLALLISSTGIILRDIEMIREATIEQLQVQAKLVEFNCDGALAFADAAAAEKLLSSMSLQPAVEMACLLDAEDRVLAAYGKDRSASLRMPAELVVGTRVTDDGYIDLVTPVIEEGEAAQALGTLYIRANTENISIHTAALVRYVIMVAIGSLLAAITVTAVLQKVISGPIRRLTEAAQVITREEDYSIRVVWPAQDELGTLYRSFNQMLDALKSTHDQVTNQAEQLALEVAVRTRAEAELVGARDAAEASSRAKSEFLANMSHEIRTPLTGILGFTDVLLAGGDDGDFAKRAEYLTTIHSSGQHLLGLINDILDLSKIESGRLEFESQACQVDRLVGDVVRVLQVKADEKSLQLAVQWETKIPRIVYTDATRMRQALMNVVGNAIKFTSQGRVDLVGRMTADRGETFIEIEVIDTGVGVAPQALASIFDPFIQADNSVSRRFGGTGLGLAISRKIARGLGGDLEVTSIPAVGSRFTLRIHAGEIKGVPLVTPETTAATQPVSAVQGKRRRLPPMKVLLVEDGETNRKLITLMLERAGATVATAENGEIGVQLAMEKSFDAILMDMQMPVVDGYTATRCLREEGATIPIIALTANAMSSDRQKCLDAGCNDYLTKPIDAVQMFDALMRATTGRRTVKSAGLESDRIQQPARRSVADASAERPPLATRDIASTLPTDDREIGEIVAEYIDTLDRKIDEMKAAWDSGNLNELAALAHWLKGSGGTAGFDVLRQPAIRLENIAKQRETGDPTGVIAEIESLHGRLITPNSGAQSK
jgi:signal transduction histidine kinase/CheY-like chemotaxis protein/HPt (histidine-containing phosphotransfer) domain-containing protein